MASGIVAKGPLVGRDDELAQLQARLKQSLSGNGNLVLVAGEAGIGKTRLIEYFGSLAIKRGARVFLGRCVPGASSPYLPFQDALISRTETHERDVGLRSWLVGPRLSGDREAQGFALDPEAEIGRTMYAAFEYLRNLADKQPIAILLEDFHWADSASIRLLHFLARNSKEKRILMVVSYRPEDLTSDLADRVHPLLEAVRAMRREGLIHEIELDRLDLEELKSTVEGILGGPADSELVERIASESGGNPLFAIEIVRLLIETKAVIQQNNRWRMVTGTGEQVPTTIKDVVLRRVDRLDTEERRTLECASAIGASFDPGILCDALGTTKLNVLETLDRIERRSRLIRALDRGYSFSHEKVRQAI